MKDVKTVGLVALALVVIGYIIFLNECRRPDPCPPVGHILVRQSLWDSLKNIKPKVDTIIIRDTIKIPSPQPPLPDPEPDSSGVEVKSYQDSLIQKDINVWVDYRIQGTLLERNWRYRPITKEVIKEIPYPVEIPIYVDRPVKMPSNGLYGNINFGGNKDSFLFGAGADFITKKDYQFGYTYQRYGNIGFHTVRLGKGFRF